MTTIIDVAREAQVSVATVSRVINNTDTVSAETAQRVEEAIGRLGYEPNILARNFRRSESRVILVLTPNIANPFYSSILTGIGDKARELGYSCMICTTGGGSAEEKAYLGMCDKRRADGAIMLATSCGPAEIEKLAASYPIVQCAEYYVGTSVAHVSVNSYEGALSAVNHLLDLGHRRIATISSSNTYQSTLRRMKGYEHALKKAGIELDNNLIRHGSFDYSFASGVAAARELLQQADRPTAIFCISDMLALGAIQGAEELGMRVPLDVSVVGFDDVEYATTFRPHITTVAQPCYELGTQSALLLYQLMQGKEDVKRDVELGCVLKIRESSAACDSMAMEIIK